MTQRLETRFIEARNGPSGGGILTDTPPHPPAGDGGVQAGAVAPLPDGLAFYQGGQRYWLTGLEHHERRDGSSVTLIALRTECPDCGALFDLRQPATGTRSLTRRCPEHRAPGRKAS